MSLGLRENRQRRRRRFWWGVTKWMLALALVLAAGAYSYRFGAQLAEREVVMKEERIVALETEVSGLQQQSAALATNLAKARETISGWQARYEREVPTGFRSEEHTSELQSLMRISYAVFCLKKKQTNRLQITNTHVNKQKRINT